MTISIIDIFDIIFKHEAIIVMIKGQWKTGKTNVGLVIAEYLLSVGLVDIVGTNIKIEETDKIRFIQDFKTLKKFHYDDPNNPVHKLFILDEAGKLVIKRGAMRRENVEWMKFIPELSKGRMKLIVITQAEFLTDSIFTDTEFTRCLITTYKNESSNNYSIGIQSELFVKPYGLDYIRVYSFPKCKIKYSPYASAEWFMEPLENEEERLFFKCCEIAKQYAVDNKSATKIANENGYISRTPVMKLIKRHIRHTLGSLTENDVNEIREELKEAETPSIVLPSEIVP